MISNQANALIELFNRQKHDLPPEQLRWLGKLSIEAQIQSSQLAEGLQLLSMLMTDGGAISAPDDEGLGLMLYGMSSKAENISAMIGIAREAEHLANQAKPTQSANQGEVAK
jgi:hypothetical protein